VRFVLNNINRETFAAKQETSRASFALYLVLLLIVTHSQCNCQCLLDFLNICSITSVHGKELATGLDGLLEVTLHVEGVLWELVTSTFQEGAETFDGVVDLDELAWLA